MSVSTSFLAVPDGMPTPFEVPFPAGSISFVQTSFVNPIENAYTGQRIAYLINDPAQIIQGLDTGGQPTVLFINLPSDPAGTPLFIGTSDVFATVNASPVPITIGDASPTYQDIISGTGGLTLDVAAPSGELAVGGGTNAIYTQPLTTAQGTMVPQDWYFYFAGGSNTIDATYGNDTVNTVAGTSLIVLGSGQDVVYSGGADTIQAGIGDASVAATVGDLVQGGAGALTFIGGSGASTVFGADGSVSANGGNGSLTVFGGTGGGYFIGGSGGNSLLQAGAGAATLQGGASGDQLFSGPAGGDVLVGGPGNETLAGAATAAHDILVGGTGNETLVAGGGNATIAGGTAGTEAIFTGPGNDLLFGGGASEYVQTSAGQSLIFAGSGPEIFGFVAGQAGGSTVIEGFNPAIDQISLQGYGAGAAQSVLASAGSAAGSTALVLPDATRITLLGLSSLPASAIVSS